MRALVLAASSGAAVRNETGIHRPDGSHTYATFEKRLGRLTLNCHLRLEDHPDARSLSAALIKEIAKEAKRIAWEQHELTSDELLDRLADANRRWKEYPGDIDMRSPFSLLQTAYQVLLALSDNLGRPEQLHLLALSLMGLACRGIRNTKRCPLCFRWAIPGHVHCHEHTRSRHDESVKQRDANRQQAKRLLTRAPSSLISVSRLPTRIAGKRLPIVLGRVLWNLRTVDEDKTLRAIERSVRASDHLRELAAFRSDQRASHALVRQLRACIDPYEYDCPSWISKLEAARIWHEAKDAWRGHRGVSRRARTVLLEACQLAEMGFNRSEVAARLEREPAAIGNWLRRYSDPEHELHDLAHRLAVALAMPRPNWLRRSDREVLWHVGALPKASTRRP